MDILNSQTVMALAKFVSELGVAAKRLSELLWYAV